MKTSKGKVYLIGAGPGDPGLLTIKAKDCLEMADVVVYDYLASPILLGYSKKDAQIIYVGKKGGDHTLSQDKINDLLVEKASQGSIVARLKGGDPFIFGRGGEEAEVLIQNGISFEIVPGVTSAIAAPAYAGIPLTHREHASSVSLITGHEDPNKKESSINWKALAESGSTLVFFMGVKNLPNITEKLMEHGKDSGTPVALVRWGTTPKQRTVAGTLETIVEDVKKAGLKSPAIIVVGSVVSLRKTMQWFETRPLFGKTIAVTRARAQASDLLKQLTELGARCIELPTIQIIPPQDPSGMINAIKGIKSYDWLIFTSVNGVKFFFQTLFSQDLDVRVLGHLKFACIGPVTKQELKAYGINADILPETYKAESVVEAFSPLNMSGKSVLIPRAKEARSHLPDELLKMGAVVTEVCAYETIPVATDKTMLSNLLENRELDMVTFTSSSTVKNFKTLIDPLRFNDLLKGVTAACIGPITADTASAEGIHPDIIAQTYTIDGLIQAILDYTETKREP